MCSRSLLAQFSAVSQPLLCHFSCARRLGANFCRTPPAMGQMLGSTKPTELPRAVSLVVQSHRECRALLEKLLEQLIFMPGKTGLLHSARDSNCYKEKRIRLRDTNILIFFKIHTVFSWGTVPVPETLLAQELGTVLLSLSHCTHLCWL